MLIYVAITVALGCAVFLLRRSALGKVALMLFTVTLCFGALETYYRYFYVRSDGFGRLSRNFAERYYHLDEHGLRASNLPPSREKRNIIVLGDSHVFGAGLKRPSERLSEQLAARHPQLHVINLGLSGWDTRTQIDQLTSRLGDTQASIPLGPGSLNSTSGMSAKLTSWLASVAPAAMKPADRPMRRTRPTPL